jgi:FkbM family methyltransferase
MNHVVAATDMPSRDVPIQTLDRAVLGAGLIPRLIKIDVEGFEADVLRGAVLAAPELIVVQTETERRKSSKCAQECRHDRVHI